MNSITVAGRVGRNSEMKETKSGVSILNFSLADDQGKDKPAIWWECSIFGKRAESLENYINKGSSVTVTGIVQQREYVNKDGVKVVAYNLAVNDICLQSKSSEDNGKPKLFSQKDDGGDYKRAKSDKSMDEDIPF